MKRMTLLAVLLVASLGCRGGIIDRVIHGDIYRGDACGSCGYQLPAGNPTGCNTCGPAVGAGYGNYEGEILSSSDYYGAPTVIDGGVINTLPAAPTTVNPLPST